MDSTDQELVRQAAKAAGFMLLQDVPAHDGSLYVQIDGKPHWWQPLTQDQDAFVLQVALRLRVEQDPEPNARARVLADTGWHKVFHDTDPRAATRRAIVLAAASLTD